MTYEDWNTGRREFCPRVDFDTAGTGFMPHTLEDALFFNANEFDRQLENWVNAAQDVLNDHETISLQDLEPAEPATEFERAGFDECTAVDTFMNMNGDTRYVTEI